MLKDGTPILRKRVRVSGALLVWSVDMTTTATNGVITRLGWFKREGSSYEWPEELNGKKIGLRGRRTMTTLDFAKQRLMYDYGAWHSGGVSGSMNAVYADGHVVPIK